MLTYFLAVKIAGLVVSTEQLTAAGWLLFFLTSEYLASNPKIKANAVYQLVTGYLKTVRHEDDQIKAIKSILRGNVRR
jgi:hypothetical protein